MPPYIAPEVLQRKGIWGDPTSTLDFCEENYISTVFIAELWNTLSNLAFIVLALVGVWYCLRCKCEMRYLVCYLGLLAVGIGSFLFHCTLKLLMQLLDELPMLILAAFTLFTLLEMGEGRGQLSSWMYIRLAVVATYTTVVSLVYLIMNDPTIHEVSYGIMVVAITYLGFRNLGRYANWKYLSFAMVSLFVYLLAFILWVIDNTFCPSFRAYRSTGPILGVLTQLHAWWHLLTAFGTYMHLVTSSRIRMEYLGHRCQVKYLVGMVPYLELQAKQLK